MKISVITTTYNRKKYLFETLESVQKSILAPHADVTFEHIIFDDASTDGTEELFKTPPFPNVKYIRSEKNMGPSHGRNNAIAESDGDYIFMIDSDDIALQRTLHNFICQAKKYPEVDWFVSDFLSVDCNLTYLLGKDYYAWKFTDSKDQLRSIFKGEHFIQSNVFFKRSLFDSAGGFDTSMRMTEDLDLFIRFLLIGKMPQSCNFTSHLHRLHNENVSVAVTLEKHMQHLAVLRTKYEIELKKQGIIG